MKKKLIRFIKSKEQKGAIVIISDYLSWYKNECAHIVLIKKKMNNFWLPDVHISLCYLVLS